MPRTLGARLRMGHDLDDDDFDALYPDWGRKMSRVHWTPVAVARRAAQWLVARPRVRVLDVGSGVGKFAIVGSLVTDGVFYGVEQRKPMVDVAQAAARGVGAKFVHFLHADMIDLDWEMFDAFYLYNPFWEGLGAPLPLRALDGATPDALAYVRAVQERLDRAPEGTRVATFHGFGGDMPPHYRQVSQKASVVRHLELWVKDRARS